MTISVFGVVVADKGVVSYGGEVTTGEGRTLDGEKDPQKKGGDEIKTHFWRRV